MKSHHPARRPATGTPEDPILAAGIVIWRNPAAPEFLLLRNSLHQTWGFAKGHLDSEESLMECALRELKEETGIELGEDDLAHDFADTSIYQPGGTAFKRVVMYLASSPCSDEVAPSAEHDQTEWCTPQRALSLLEPQELRRTLVRAAGRIFPQ